METWVVGTDGSGIDWKLILTILIPGVLVVAGWFASNWLTSKREFQARRREAKVEGMKAAFMRLASCSGRDSASEEVMELLEMFVSEIQLYGTPKQVGLARKLVDDFVTKKPFVSHDALLEDLRDELRKELLLEPITDMRGVAWLRFERPKLAAPNATGSPAPTVA